MNHITEKYNDILKQVLGDITEDIQRVEYKKTETWNSLNQFCIINAIEDTFGFIFEPKDIIRFRTYYDGLEIILEKLENN